MIHYHGTPITPRRELLRMAGKSFCVSFADKRDAVVCREIGQSVLWDNGAFTAFTRGKSVNEGELYMWLDNKMLHPHRAVVLDRIGGDEDEQRSMVKRWPFPKSMSFPVWHLNLSLAYLDELVDGGWAGVALGSAGEFWQVGSPAWTKRMYEVFDHLKRNGDLPWLHGLRMLGQSAGLFPLASADSANVARNYKCAGKCPVEMASEIDARQPSPWWFSKRTVETA